jgi:hypothetical protein
MRILSILRDSLEETVCYAIVDLTGQYSNDPILIDLDRTIKPVRLKIFKPRLPSLLATGGQGWQGTEREPLQLQNLNAPMEQSFATLCHLSLLLVCSKTSNSYDRTGQQEQVPVIVYSKAL